LTTKSRLFGFFLCALFGFIGGATSNLILNTRTVAAQEPPKVLQAQRFQVINQHGKVVGELGADLSIEATHLYLAYEPKGNGIGGNVTSRLDATGLSLGHTSGETDIFIGLMHDDFTDMNPFTPANPLMWVRTPQQKVITLVGRRP